MSARRMSAASPSISSAWWRSIAVASRGGRPQRRASTPPTNAWSTPSSPRPPGIRPPGGLVAAELPALAVYPLLGGLGLAVHLAGVAGVGVRQDQLAHVVKQRGDEQLVAVLVLGLL